MSTIIKTYQIILLGGGSSAGKSVVARQLARTLGSDFISADDIRIAIGQTHASDHPVNFFLQENIVRDSSVAVLVTKHEEVSHIVCKGLEAVVRHHDYIKKFDPRRR